MRVGELADDDDDEEEFDGERGRASSDAYGGGRDFSGSFMTAGGEIPEVGQLVQQRQCCFSEVYIDRVLLLLDSS